MEYPIPMKPTHQQDFRDGFQPRESDAFIAVMGVTGSGKSTFISHCADKTVEIGSTLQACMYGWNPTEMMRRV
jgi:type IV secretory pathway VirB4 component